MENIKSFTIKLVFLTAFMEALTLLWMFFSIDESYVSSSMPFIPPLFMAFTFIMHKVLHNTLNQEFKFFQRKFMLMTTIKLLSMLMILVLFVFFKSEDAIPFSVSFLLNYLAFTFFEARALLLNSSK